MRIFKSIKRMSKLLKKKKEDEKLEPGIPLFLNERMSNKHAYLF